MLQYVLSHTSLVYQFDLCDPARHFALVVPQRALQCPALMSAIYTASARHLCRLERYKRDGEVEYLGQRLPDLRSESAVEYHSDCINHLVQLSSDQDALYDEDLLAASVILRFYEEVDGQSFSFPLFTGSTRPEVCFPWKPSEAIHRRSSGLFSLHPWTEP